MDNNPMDAGSNPAALAKMPDSYRMNSEVTSESERDRKMEENPPQGELANFNKKNMNEPQQIQATLIEIGDDEDGNPRLIFRTTREQISRLKTLPLYKWSELTIQQIEETK